MAKGDRIVKADKSGDKENNGCFNRGKNGCCDDNDVGLDILILVKITKREIRDKCDKCVISGVTDNGN